MAGARGNRGVPEATAAAMLQIVDADEPPLRVFFGAAPAAGHRRHRVLAADRHLGEVERPFAGR
jgi:hypothetical protein